MALVSMNTENKKSMKYVQSGKPGFILSITRRKRSQQQKGDRFTDNMSATACGSLTVSLLICLQGNVTDLPSGRVIPGTERAKTGKEENKGTAKYLLWISIFCAL